MKAVCFLDYLVLCVCIYGVRGGMHDMELLDGRGKGVMVLVLLRPSVKDHRPQSWPLLSFLVHAG